MVMRIITVRQPWAAAIIHGGKNVENRVRNIAGDYRGPLAIHAALKDDPGVNVTALAAAFPTAAGLEDVARIRGEILGVVDLVDVHTAPMYTDDVCYHAPSVGEPEVIPLPRCSPWAQVDAHHLVLANPTPLTRTIPYRGALGMRNLDASTERAIRALLPVYEYGFMADGQGPFWYTFGGLVGFETYEMAKHTGEKSYTETLEIVRRIRGGDGTWESCDE